MKIYHILFLAIAINLTSCNYLDMGGMFVVNESVNERFEQSLLIDATNEIAELSASTDDYNIFSMGDVHIGSTFNFDKAIEQIKNQANTALVLNGDICNGNDYDYDLLEQHLPDKNDLKYFSVIGNHELYFAGWQAYYSRFGTSTYCFSVKTPAASDLFICLDTGSGTLGSKQLEWFKNVLNNIRPNYRRCVIFTHNNLYRIRHTTSTNPTNEELIVLTELFAKYNIDMVVTGHDHIKNEVKFGNTIHITMQALLDGFPDAGYFKLNIKAGKLNYEFIEL